VVTASETQPAPLRRDRSKGVLGGVCAGLGRRLGVDPLILRVGFVIAAAAGGTGVILYAICWALLPAGEEGGRSVTARAIGRRESWMVASGLVLLMLAVLLLFRAWGVWVGDAVVWPLVLATGGGALIWRQSQGAAVVEAPARERAAVDGDQIGAERPRRLLRLARPSLGIVALGALFLLDQLGVIDLKFGYAGPAVLAAIGAVLLIAGLTE
jgi:phage shock protein PspC (stress-responsive transcriptional regulator)